jgi:hypothetical protein
MTKVGESFQPPHPKTPKDQMRKKVEHLKILLNDYDKAQTEQQRIVLRDKMHAEISLMNEMASSLNKEIRVQEKKVAKDFQNFNSKPHDKDTEFVFKHDISTLGESLEH